MVIGSVPAQSGLREKSESSFRKAATESADNAESSKSLLLEDPEVRSLLAQDQTFDEVCAGAWRALTCSTIGSHLCASVTYRVDRVLADGVYRHSSSSNVPLFSPRRRFQVLRKLNVTKQRHDKEARALRRRAAPTPRLFTRVVLWHSDHYSHHAPDTPSPACMRCGSVAYSSRHRSIHVL